MQLLATYGGSSSEADEADEAVPPAPKRSRVSPPPPARPAPPPLFSAAPEVHGGRVRSFPHVEGNYAVSVFCALAPPPPAQEQRLASLLRRCAASLPAGTQLVPLSLATLHLSLCSPCAIRRHQSASLYAQLRARLRGAQPQLPAQCWLGGGQPLALLNDTRTRTFLALPLLLSQGDEGGTSAASAALAGAVEAVDGAFGMHGLPSLRPEGGTAHLPHVSVAWALGDVVAELQAAAESVSAEGLPGWPAPLACVRLRVGQLEASCFGEGVEVDRLLKFRGR